MALVWDTALIVRRSLGDNILASVNIKRTLPRRPPKLNKGRALTCCIAAIANGGHVFGAADRMLTSGDIEFEPKGFESNDYNQKIVPVTSSIVIMAAGDMGLQSEIIHHHVLPAVQKRISADPDKWLAVESVVEMYVSGYNIVRRNRAETQILAPLGLTFKSFGDQSKFSQSFLDNITTRLLEYSLPTSVETIVVGVEPGPVPNQTFSRLYTIHENVPTCCDAIRFAAIGIGSRHAESHMMQVSHGLKTEVPETVLAVYVAKKRSEIAPGVGKDTNMILLGSQLGSFDWVKPAIIKELDLIYKTLDAQENKALQEAAKSSTDLVNSLSAKPPSDQQNAPDKPDAEPEKP